MAKVKKKDHEKLTDANIAKVINLLEEEKPITKKQACELLNISYNTTRLQTIIDNFKIERENILRRRREKRGTPATDAEKAVIAESFLSGEPVVDIAKRIYRTTTFVNNVLARLGIPERPQGDDKFKISLLPDECVSEDFEVGEIVWSSIHHKPCEIRRIFNEESYLKKYDTKCYRIYVLESVEEHSPYFPSIETGGYYAAAASYDLGKLTHIKNLGIKLERL